ncbi:MAG: hypothetical protein HY720_30090 [Planctomycetes bacterium]|nr:hypothetical protein [Planctomycetota bacterium]
MSAYARLMGVKLQTVDLDLYAPSAESSALLEWASRTGVRIVKRPKPRTLPVTVLEWRGEEIDVLSSSRGLPPPDVAISLGRDFVLEPDGLSIPVADPFHLLANKMAIRRPKDLPHIEILRRFVEEEVVEAFRCEEKPRDRLAPANRLLDALGKEALEPELFDRLVPLARIPSDYRFLAHRAPGARHVERLAERLRVEGELALEAEISSIAAKRAEEAHLG